MVDEDFGTLTQCFDAGRWRDMVIRFSGYLKTAEVRGWAGLWMRVDGSDGETLRFDNMASPVDRSIAGTTDWAQYEIVLDIPEEAVTICLGFLLHGSGTVWADDLDLEFLDRGQQEEDKPSSSRASRSVTIPSLTAPGSRLSPTGGERDPNGGGS
jgi:hypothetical protein